MSKVSGAGGRDRFGSLLRFVASCSTITTGQHIIELGCGDQLDTTAHPSQARIVGIDYNLASLSRVQAQRSTSVQIIQADINRLPLRRHSFDLVVARHPDIDAHPGSWREGLVTAPDWLTSDGIILVTCYAPHELETLRRWLTPTPLMPIAIDERQLIAPDLAGRDRFALLYRIRKSP